MNNMVEFKLESLKLNIQLADDSRHKRLKVGRACHPCRMKKIKVV